jgi:hypothetical protein
MKRAKTVIYIFYTTLSIHVHDVNYQQDVNHIQNSPYSVSHIVRFIVKRFLNISHLSQIKC